MEIDGLKCRKRYLHIDIGRWILIDGQREKCWIDIDLEVGSWIQMEVDGWVEIVRYRGQRSDKKRDVWMDKGSLIQIDIDDSCID